MRKVGKAKYTPSKFVVILVWRWAGCLICQFLPSLTASNPVFDGA